MPYTDARSTCAPVNESCRARKAGTRGPRAARRADAPAAQRCVLPLPDDADLLGAGALLAAYLTAWRMLFGKRALRPDETVLVAGIGGGVAVACLQLARHAGARVIVTSSSDDKLARAAAIG